MPPINPQIREKAVRMLRAGHTPAAVAAALGIADVTIHTWRRRFVLPAAPKPPAPPRPPRPPVARSVRTSHSYDAPRAGRIVEAVFVQPLTGEIRTAEVVRFAGSECWKVTFKETQSFIRCMGDQAEYPSESAACSEATDFLMRSGLRMVRYWQAVAREWQAAPTIPPARRSDLGGLIQ